MESQFTLRLPKKLNDKVASEAKVERRSKNEHIVRILEQRYGINVTASAKQPDAIAA